MKSFEERQQQWEEKRQKWEARWQHRHKKRNGKVWFGVFLFIIGAFFLMKKLMLPVPAWLFSWPMLLILIGLLSGIRNRFREGGWLFMMLVGGIFLVGKIAPDVRLSQFIWPAAFMLAGIWIIIKPRRKNRWGSWDDCGFDNDDDDEPEVVDQKAETVEPGSTGNNGPENRRQDKDRAGNTATEDYADYTSVFGGVEKTIFSKNFRGGEIVNVFGGANLNLSQADIQGPVTLEVVQIFGGSSLIIPPDWDVKSEMTTIFGGVDDKRETRQAPDPEKTLIIKGTSIFGGIELKNF